MRIGIGYDVHALTKNRELVLGGVKIPWDRGLAGHSDADVLTHAVMDALLGAAALGDIGKHFPDTDERFRNISSLLLLEEVGEIIRRAGYMVGNIDAVVAAQEPRLAPYIPQMASNLAGCLGVGIHDVSVKATTTEKLGFIGRCQGISAQAVALLLKL